MASSAAPLPYNPPVYFSKMAPAHISQARSLVSMFSHQLSNAAPLEIWKIFSAACQQLNNAQRYHQYPDLIENVLQFSVNFLSPQIEKHWQVFSTDLKILSLVSVFSFALHLAAKSPPVFLSRRIHQIAKEATYVAFVISSITTIGIFLGKWFTRTPQSFSLETLVENSKQREAQQFRQNIRQLKQLLDAYQ